MSTSLQGTSERSGEQPVPRPGPRAGLLWLLRVLVLIHGALVFAQPVLAGLYLSGDFDALGVHADNASMLTAASLFQLIAAVLFWLAGRGRSWPVVVSVVLFATETLQIGYGYSRDLGLHIPLGVFIVVLMALLLVGVFLPSARRGRRPLPFRSRRDAR